MALNGFLFSLLGVALLLAIGLGAAPRDAGDEMAVVFAPWTPAALAVEQATAGGRTLVRIGRFPFIVIVHAGKGGLPGPAARLGAWFLLDASALLGCLGAGGSRA